MSGKTIAVMNKKHIDLSSGSLQTSGHVAWAPEKADGEVPTVLGGNREARLICLPTIFPFFLNIISNHIIVSNSIDVIILKLLYVYKIILYFNRMHNEITTWTQN